MCHAFSLSHSICCLFASQQHACCCLSSCLEPSCCAWHAACASSHLSLSHISIFSSLSQGKSVTWHFLFCRGQGSGSDRVGRLETQAALPVVFEKHAKLARSPPCCFLQHARLFFILHLHLQAACRHKIPMTLHRKKRQRRTSPVSGHWHCLLLLFSHGSKQLFSLSRGMIMTRHGKWRDGVKTSSKDNRREEGGRKEGMEDIGRGRRDLPTTSIICGLICLEWCSLLLSSGLWLAGKGLPFYCLCLPACLCAYLYSLLLPFTSSLYSPPHSFLPFSPLFFSLLPSPFSSFLYGKEKKEDMAKQTLLCKPHTCSMCFTWRHAHCTHCHHIARRRHGSSSSGMRRLGQPAHSNSYSYLSSHHSLVS